MSKPTEFSHGSSPVTRHVMPGRLDNKNFLTVLGVTLHHCIVLDTPAISSLANQPIKKQELHYQVPSARQVRVALVCGVYTCRDRTRYLRGHAGAEASFVTSR